MAEANTSLVIGSTSLWVTWMVLGLDINVRPFHHHSNYRLNVNGIQKQRRVWEVGRQQDRSPAGVPVVKRFQRF